MCTCIIASGIFFGLKKIQPQAPLQFPSTNSSINDKALNNTNLANISKIAEKNEKNGSGIEDKLRQEELNNIEENQLNNIDKIFNEKRQKLESYYNREFVQLEYNTKAALANLDAAQNAAYANLLQALKNTISESQGFATMDAYVWNDNYISGYGSFAGTTRTSVEGNPVRNYEVENTQIANAKTGTLRYYQQIFIELQDSRKHALFALAKERQEKIDLVKANISSAKKPRQQFSGIVVGIVFSKANPSAVIADSIVREGNTIHGVKVVKIYRDRIEFEKNGKNWTQQVGDSPNPAWQE